MLTSAQLKQITAEARPIIERQLDDALKLAGLRDVVAAAGGDWSQLKALIKAQIQDEETGDGKRVRKILDKADYATAYADMLGLSAFSKMNEENFFEGDIPEHDAEGVIIEPQPAMAAQTAGSETAVAAGAPEGEHSPHASEPIRRMSMTPLEPREAGGLKGFGFTVRFDEPEAAMLPQTAGSETAVANSTPGSGAGTVDAGEANWPSEMTTASPANEPETIPPVADPATVVSEAANGDSAPSLAAIPVADRRSQPNPICRDPDDCGVYASWAMPCQACKAAAAHRSAA